jgi:HAD superfamily hydrolase (TIGR01509 family)
MLTNIKAAIFDMDGTLVDSMWVWRKIDIDYLENRNISFPADLKSCIEHLSFLEVAKYFKERFNIPESIDEIMNEWTSMAYHEYATEVKLKPGAGAYLALLKSLGIKIALATSNSKELLEVTLKNNNIFEYFDVICRTDEVTRGKDFPDVYLLTAKRLGVSPEQCIVFEDILPAVIGAKAAGMKVVGVHDLYSEEDACSIKEHADYYILRYEELA